MDAFRSAIDRAKDATPKDRADIYRGFVLPKIKSAIDSGAFTIKEGRDLQGYLKKKLGVKFALAEAEDYANKQKVKEYTVEKRGSQWCLIAKSTGKTLGCHDTEEGAIAQERAVQANKHSKKNGKINLVEFKTTIGDPKEFAEKIGTKDPGFFTRCMDSDAASRVDDPKSFCAWLHNEVLGYYPSEHKKESTMPFKTHMTREEISNICLPCGEKMAEKGIAALNFSDEQVAKFAGMNMKTCMEDVAKVKEYPDETERKTACQKEMDKAVMQAIQETKGGPNMDEKKFDQEKAQLKAEKESAEAKAKEYQDKLAALEAANEEAKQKETEALAKVKRLERKNCDAETESWIAAQKRAGKLAPVEESRLRAIFGALYEDQRTVTFSQADGKEAKESLPDAIKSFIVSRPSIFTELSRSTPEPNEPMDNPGDELNRLAKEYQKKNSVKEYKVAFEAVKNDNPELTQKWLALQQ